MFASRFIVIADVMTRGRSLSSFGSKKRLRQDDKNLVSTGESQNGI
jgi:hypothetical protein